MHFSFNFNSKIFGWRSIFSARNICITIRSTTSNSNREFKYLLYYWKKRWKNDFLHLLHLLCFPSETTCWKDSHRLPLHETQTASQDHVPCHFWKKRRVEQITWWTSFPFILLQSAWKSFPADQIREICRIWIRSRRNFN